MEKSYLPGTNLPPLVSRLVDPERPEAKGLDGRGRDGVAVDLGAEPGPVDRSDKAGPEVFAMVSGEPADQAVVHVRMGKDRPRAAHRVQRMADLMLIRLVGRDDEQGLSLTLGMQSVPQAGEIANPFLEDRARKEARTFDLDRPQINVMGFRLLPEFDPLRLALGMLDVRREALF